MDSGPRRVLPRGRSAIPSNPTRHAWRPLSGAPRHRRERVPGRDLWVAGFGAARAREGDGRPSEVCVVSGPIDLCVAPGHRNPPDPPSVLCTRVHCRPERSGPKVLDGSYRSMDTIGPHPGGKRSGSSSGSTTRQGPSFRPNSFAVSPSGVATGAPIRKRRGASVVSCQAPSVVSKPGSTSPTGPPS